MVLIQGIVAMANNEANVVGRGTLVRGRERDEQLGLAARFQAVAIRATGLHHLFDELALPNDRVIRPRYG